MKGASRILMPVKLLAILLIWLEASYGVLAGKLPSFTSADEGIQKIKLPPGFKIEVYAKDVSGARSLALGPRGIVFVGSRGSGDVYAIVPQGGTTAVRTIASGLHSPNGVAFRDGALYVAEISRVLKIAGIEGSLDHPPQPSVVSSGFPSAEAHGWKFIRFGPDGKLYVPVGMPCNICEQEDKRFGTIMRMNADGSGLEVYASGIRNTVGFDWDPGKHELWFTDNGRDNLGDDVPPDELNHAPRAGMNFGFPYFNGNNVPNPEFSGKDPSRCTPAAMDLEAHVAALGMRFYTGNLFPARYRNGIFIAEHGSWNRSVPIGYRVVFVKMENGRAVSREVFAEGWLQGRVAWGRPVDVEVLPDGSLLVSDDKADAVYRITYQGAGGKPGR